MISTLQLLMDPWASYLNGHWMKSEDVYGEEEVSKTRSDRLGPMRYDRGVQNHFDLTWR